MVRLGRNLCLIFPEKLNREDRHRIAVNCCRDGVGIGQLRGELQHRIHKNLEVDMGDAVGIPAGQVKEQLRYI